MKSIPGLFILMLSLFTAVESQATQLRLGAYRLGQCSISINPTRTGETLQIRVITENGGYGNISINGKTNEVLSINSCNDGHSTFHYPVTNAQQNVEGGALYKANCGGLTKPITATVAFAVSNEPARMGRIVDFKISVKAGMAVIKAPQHVFSCL